MFERPYLYGLPPGIESTDGRTVQDLFNSSGRNTGNFLFTTAVHRLTVDLPMAYGHSRDAAHLRENHDCIVIPAANWIDATSDLSPLADLVEEANLPCMLVGVGAQAGSKNSGLEVTAGTKRFLRAVSERSHSISVRGDYTKQVLESLGIGNAVVTGCPSMLFRPKDAPIVWKGTSSLDDTALNSTRHSYSEEIFLQRPAQAAHLALYRLAQRQELDVVLQSELPDFYYAMGRFANTAIVDEATAYLERVYDCSAAQLVPFLKRKQHVFFDTTSWENFLAKKEFVFGTRIHGAVSALNAGVPARVLTHDSRTTELCESMAIPAISVDEVDDLSAAEVLEIVNDTDFAEFNDRFEGYRSRFVSYFEDNGLAIASV